ncbi:competence protein CoiA [Enterococcus ratti]|uniref:Competence protein CoiA n=1 Tax=Enterococcus ratti TaxID=150033 RepID=A0A1L8WHL3_9ENTE|nr:competence protein CoiA family protein [Enterococcus ratti]OJG80515.1 hypothetical protein RV14_GL000577 [Enterococcus ratti]
MMIAVDKNGKKYMAIESKQQQSLFCPCCHEPVILKNGRQKIAHFAHQRRKSCYGFSEGETNEHLQLKQCFYEWCKQLAKESPVYLEAYLSDLHQRPDILCGSQAIEIQCSALTYKKMESRTKGYLTKGYNVWWILGSSFFKNDYLKVSEKCFCMYSETRGIHLWQLDWTTKKLYLFYQLKESVSGNLTFETTSWEFFSEQPVNLSKGHKKRNKIKRTLSKNISQKWLQKKLHHRNLKYLYLQKQCYLRTKHLLFLSPWVYQDSQFFFYFQEKIFFYRLVFEEVELEQKKRSNQWKYILWLQKIDSSKSIWLFPMIEKKKIYRLLYEECQKIFFL